MKALPYVGELAKQVDKGVPYLSGSPKATIHVAQKIDRVMPFGKFGDVSSSSRYIAADKYIIASEHTSSRW